MANITGDSPQAVAFALLEEIARAEDWSGSGPAWQGAPRPWRKTKAEILDTYNECLEAVLDRYLRWGPFA
jgi:hypothetical protein